MSSSAMIDAARDRAAKAERDVRAECEQLHLPDNLQRQVSYIEQQIDLGTREDDDITLLKSRRKQIMAQAERRRNG